MNDKSKSDEKLPKKEIIRSKLDFKDIIQNGQRWNGQSIRCFYLEGEKREVGFAAPKRLGHAVMRNRLKRFMREIYRKNKYRLRPMRLIIIANESAEKAGYRGIEKDFHHFLEFTAKGRS
jgi:ribonuclease P protein component